MSIKDRLAKKTEGLLVPGKPAGSGTAGPLKTGPGQMLMVNALMKETNEKVAQLEDRLKEFEGATVARMLDAEKVVASKWANRIEDGFKTAEFASLKEEIRLAGGNVQPIKVRPRDGGEQFEIVFGHRRHRACLELGLPVLALIDDDVSEQDLFKEMDRENRARLDLSPWEQGRMYRRALDEGLFVSLGQLAEELGADKGNISKALRLADLPPEVVEAFPSPRELQYRWAKLLNDALQSDPEGVLSRAREVCEHKDMRPSGKEVLEVLIGVTKLQSKVDPVIINGKLMAEIITEGEKVSVKFAKGAVPQAKAEQLKSLLVGLLKG